LDWRGGVEVHDAVWAVGGGEHSEDLPGEARLTNWKIRGD